MAERPELEIIIKDDGSSVRRDPSGERQVPPPDAPPPTPKPPVDVPSEKDEPQSSGSLISEITLHARQMRELAEEMRAANEAARKLSEDTRRSAVEETSPESPPESPELPRDRMPRRLRRPTMQQPGETTVEFMQRLQREMDNNEARVEDIEKRIEERNKAWRQIRKDQLERIQRNKDELARADEPDPEVPVAPTPPQLPKRVKPPKRPPAPMPQESAEQGEEGSPVVDLPFLARAAGVAGLGFANRTLGQIASVVALLAELQSRIERNRQEREAMQREMRSPHLAPERPQPPAPFTPPAPPEEPRGEPVEAPRDEPPPLRPEAEAVPRRPAPPAAPPPAAPPPAPPRGGGRPPGGAPPPPPGGPPRPPRPPRPPVPATPAPGGGLGGLAPALTRFAGPIAAVTAGLIVARQAVSTFTTALDDPAAAMKRFVPLSGEIDKATAAFNRFANQLERFSPEITIARTRQQVAQEMGDIRRANIVGEDLARFIELQTQVSQTLQDIKAILQKAALETILPLLERIVNMFVDLVQTVGKGAKGVDDFLDNNPLIDAAQRAAAAAANPLIGKMLYDFIRNGIDAFAALAEEDAKGLDPFLDQLFNMAIPMGQAPNNQQPFFNVQGPQGAPVPGVQLP